MVERVICYLIGGTVALTVLASVLPRILPAAIVVFVMVIVGRLIFYFTSRDRW
jgi:hypothetical protein